MNEREEIAFLQVRELVYAFLGSVFLNTPSHSQIQQIIQHQLFDDFPLEIDQNDFQRGLQKLRNWAKNCLNTKLKDILVQLHNDYSRLFVGPGNLLAPPWESLYLTKEKLSFAFPALEVREFFRRHGLQSEHNNNKPDDHFGLEMEFISKLIQKERVCLEKENLADALELSKEQLLFLQEHVMKWSDSFTDLVFEHADTDYYKGLALLTKGYLTWDYGLLRDRLSSNPS